MSQTGLVHFVQSDVFEQFIWILTSLNITNTMHEFLGPENPNSNHFDGCILIELQNHRSENFPFNDKSTTVLRIHMSLNQNTTNFLSNWLDYTKLYLDEMLNKGQMFCTWNMRLDKVSMDPILITDFEKHLHKNSTKIGPFTNEVQLFVVITFCSILLVCFLMALVLRIKNFFKRQTESRKPFRRDRDSHFRIHFPYDVSDTQIVEKPPVPSTTFGSTVYPRTQRSLVHRYIPKRHRLNCQHSNHMMNYHFGGMRTPLGYTESNQPRVKIIESNGHNHSTVITPSSQAESVQDQAQIHSDHFNQPKFPKISVPNKPTPIIVHNRHSRRGSL